MLELVTLRAGVDLDEVKASEARAKKREAAVAKAAMTRHVKKVKAKGEAIKANCPGKAVAAAIDKVMETIKDAAELGMKAEL